MKAQRLKSVAPGIVARLRAVFIAISVILLISTVFGLAQLRDFNRSVDKLAVSSVTVFVRTEETERALKKLLLLLQHIDLIEGNVALATLSQKVHTQLVALRTDTAELTNFGLSGAAADRLQTSLDRIEMNAEKMLDAKSTVLQQELALKGALATLETLRSKTRILVETLSHDAAQSNKTVFNTGQTAGKDTYEVLEQRYHQGLLSATSITAIALETEAIIDLALGLTNNITIDDLDALEDSLRFKMRGVVAQISQLGPSQARSDLAIAFVEMRRLLFDPGQIFESIADLEMQRAALDRFIYDQLIPIDELSNLSADLTETARAQIDVSRQDLTQTTFQMIILLVLASFLTLCTIGCAIFFIVERQINQRMARLTKSVLAIADGQKEQTVNVHGRDELGMMANALKVFKLNAEELRRSNAELEKFAYVASHDLRSPLRAIQDLAEWTIADEESVLSADGKENMTLLKSRIARLNKLLADLLEYSRAGQEDCDISDIPVAKLVSDIAESLDPRGAFQIEYLGEVDKVETYATPLRQILFNLINNAIKHHDHDTGVVSVSISRNSGRLLCRVTDDGAGIDRQYHDRIFDLFQTLRPRDEVEGSGLGLAIISKLLDHYECKIEIQSTPELRRGSSFVFDFPDKSTRLYNVNRAA